LEIPPVGDSPLLNNTDISSRTSQWNRGLAYPNAPPFVAVILARYPQSHNRSLSNQNVKCYRLCGLYGARIRFRECPILGATLRCSVNLKEIILPGGTAVVKREGDCTSLPIVPNVRAMRWPWGETTRSSHRVHL
jgi:hypothetical protein